MRVNVAQAAAAASLSPPSPQNASLSPRKLCFHRSESSFIVGSHFAKLSSSKSTAPVLRRSCSATFDGPDFAGKRSPMKKTKSLRHLGSPQVDVLEPSLLGIRPEPPEWPGREEMIRDCIARRASIVELPLSLRMIKLKQRIQKLEEERENGDLGEIAENQTPISNLCNSTLYIIKEVQSHALKIRGLVLDEDLDGISGKVQKEMTSSFVWLFREVFAKTPDLMLDVMVLTSNFTVQSLENFTEPVKSLKIEERLVERERERESIKWGIGQLELGKSGVPAVDDLEGMEERELGLWNSVVEEANEMRGMEKNQGLGFVDHDDIDGHDDINVDDGLREEKKKKVELEFVSPVRVEIEGDEYGEYYSTNLIYQIGLSQDPKNTLLLSNYAQFLWLVSRDYDRAEECFKRAVQLDPGDAEVVSQYANFLWLVRKDLWGAEERYQQAMAAEPENSFHASKYASFLWNTGAEDTCYPLDSPQA